MFKKSLLLTLLICFASAPSFAIEAEKEHRDTKDNLHLNAIYAITSILIDINGKPSSADEERLRDIINDDLATQNERIFASSLLFMDGKVQVQDQEKLLRFIESKSTPIHIHNIADILYRFHGKISKKDKKKLLNILD